MLSIINTILLSLAVLILIGISFYIYKHKKNDMIFDASGIYKEIEKQFKYQSDLYSKINDLMLSSIKNYNDNVTNTLSQAVQMQTNQFNSLQQRLENILKSNELRLNQAIAVIDKNLCKIQQDNEKKLEEMRQTVDEKLSSSLEKRLTESFNVINNRLQSVYEGLGEMKNLASGVGDLKRVLTNVKTRGVWGEVQLGSLLEQMLSPNQFQSNVQTKRNSQERVDYAIIMPGKDGDLLLPIDAKFPIEDYQRLIAASEAGDAGQIELSLKGIERRVKEEAKKIHDKYIDVPKTTDFAIMYLAIEGMYAEVLRRPGIIESLQNEYKIIICGPTTLSAILNSLQLGFKTLAIEKRSSEIWSLLSTFKKEFSNFTLLLSKTQKKLEEATDTIEDATKKTRTIEKKLKDVSEIGEETVLIEND